VRKSIYATCLMAVALAGTTVPAYAYLDPGTGSMILQVLLGGVAGVALAGKLYWHRFLVTIGARSETTDDRSTDQPKPRTER
jgi:hypothetical protein